MAERVGDGGRPADGGRGDEARREGDPLVIRSVEFMGGMASVTGWRPPSELPEVAFSGRSNVGKSSLLNRLVRRRAMARVSRTPGRTREINFFRVNDRFVIVDLPGYGYAKISKERKAEWRPLIEGYLRSPQLRGVVQLLDVRRDPSEDDLAMLDYLADLELPTVVVITKIDKLGARAAAARVAELTRALGLDEGQVIPFSAHTGAGRDDLALAVSSLVGPDGGTFSGAPPAAPSEAPPDAAPAAPPDALPDDEG